MSTRVWIGGMDEYTREQDVRDFFRDFGRLRSVWVARKPPGFAYVDFEDIRDAEDAVKDRNNEKLCGVRVRVEFARSSGRGGDRPRRDSDGCYKCGEQGHFARECTNPSSSSSGRDRSDRDRDRDRDRNDRDRDRDRDRSDRGRDRDRSDRGRSRRDRSPSKSRSRSRSKSRSPPRNASRSRRDRSASASPPPRRDRNASPSPAPARGRSRSASRSASPARRADDPADD